MSATVTLYATAASRDEARRLARTLLERRLVACANLAPIESLYWWEGAIEEAEEVALLLKTTADKAEAAIAALAEVHGYDVPCAVVLQHGAVHEPYAAWVRRETAPGK